MPANLYIICHDPYGQNKSADSSSLGAAYVLKRVNNIDMIQHLENILKKEKISPERTALQLICREAEGSLRDALSLLDQVLLNSDDTIKSETVNEMIGKVSKVRVLELLNLIPLIFPVSFQLPLELLYFL